jgi:uncharacterized membrane protein YhaH (DUF805 family)
LSNPYIAPIADMSRAGEDDDLYQPELFSFKGRIGRCRYLAYSIGLSMILMLVAGMLMALTGAKAINNSPLLALWYVPVLVITFTMAVRRLNDMNHPGWWSLLMLIPIINMFVGLWLAFGRGDDRANNYGPAPAPNTWQVIVGACAMPLIMVIGILAAVAIPASATYKQKAMAARQGQAPAPAPPQLQQ